MKEKLKQLKRKILNPILFGHIKPSVNCACVWYGNTYGGFYLNPNIIHEEAIVYSFGIGEDISFDLDLIQKHKSNVFGFDPTPKSIKWCSEQNLPSQFKLTPVALAKESGTLTFHLPKNDDHVSGSSVGHENVSKLKSIDVEAKSLSDIVAELGHTKIDVLKMDIEGSEYDVLDSVLEVDLDVGQFAIEFHERFFQDGKDLTKLFIEKMKLKGYEVCAVSDTYEEVTFVNTSWLK